MNFITVMVSVFFTNYILLIIVRYLPFSKKKLWGTLFVSLASGSSLVTYLVLFISYLVDAAYVGFSAAHILRYVGSILGIILAYIASMMMIFQGFTGFTSRRTRKFNREINNKGSNSIPRNIIGIILAVCAIGSFTLGVFSTIYYTPSVILSLVGGYVFGALFLGAAIYFFATGNFKSTASSNGNNFMFILQENGDTTIYTKELTKDIKEESALGPLGTTYFLDDFGYLITPEKKYYVKGIKVLELEDDLRNQINMEKCNYDLSEIISEFKRYEKRKITIDANNKIIKNVKL